MNRTLKNKLESTVFYSLYALQKFLTMMLYTQKYLLNI